MLAALLHTAGAAGMVVGGFLVGRVERLERVIGICLLASAALVGGGVAARRLRAA